MSGGQQQHVAIARALIHEPEIILAEEPIASLDPRNTQAVMDARLWHSLIKMACIALAIVLSSISA